MQSAKINQSLLALGRVITHLADKPAAGRVSKQHVPYRDSNLTRLLQPVLGGNSATAIIATVAPGRSSLENTKATLHFVSVAAKVRLCSLTYLKRACRARWQRFSGWRADHSAEVLRRRGLCGECV